MSRRSRRPRCSVSITVTSFARSSIAVGALAALACVAMPVRAALYELEPHLHAKPGTASDMFDSAGNPVSEAPPAGALIPVIEAAKASGGRPTGSNWNFTGTTAGADLWVLPNIDGTGILYLGMGWEEIDAADLDGPITMSLVGVSGPGVFSMWDGASPLATPTPLVTSASGFVLPNAVVLTYDHMHFNYGFTAPGLYNVTFEATGTLAAALGGGAVSGLGTFAFGVFDDLDAYPDVVPSPGPYAFFGRNFDNFIYGDGHLDLGVALATAAVPEIDPSGIGSVLAVVFGAGGLLERRRRKQSA